MGDGKVKVFDATNWTLEKTFVQTKSNVASLIAVGETQVWAGSQGIFIIDTATITSNKILTEHQDLVTDMAVTENGRFVFSASVGGCIIRWEVQTLTNMSTFTLSQKEISLRSVYLHEDHLWCGTWESILVVDFEGNHLQTFQYQTSAAGVNRPEQLDCFLVLGDEVWAGCRRAGVIVVWDMKTAKQKAIYKLENCRGISIMRYIDGKIWVGTKDGMIFIYKDLTGKIWKTIKAHDDAVRALCAAESRYVMSGAGSKDGKVAIWSPRSVIEQSGHHHEEDC